MGAGMFIAKLIGKKLGEAALGAEKKIVWFSYKGHNPFEPVIKDTREYTEKIAELANETHKVNADYLRGLVQEANRHHDFDALKRVYEYMDRLNWHDSLFKTIVRYGQELKLRETIGDPFALVESVVRHLC